MATEIEHKYLVISANYREISSKKFEIRQGYITKDKERVVRIRISNNDAFITIKSKNVGDTRLEFEYPIPFNDAMELLKNVCLPDYIEKTRYIVEYDNNKWEIDEFHGRLEGLKIAEIEIPYSDYNYSIPPFIGAEVTSDPKYYNSNL